MKFKSKSLPIILSYYHILYHSLIHTPSISGLELNKSVIENQLHWLINRSLKSYYGDAEDNVN